MSGSIDLDSVLDKLMKVAEQDGIMQDDEKTLIKSLMKNAEKYSQILDEALKDGIIDKREQSRLLQYRLSIANKAKEVAQADLMISPEEKDLMIEFHKILLETENLLNKKK